MITPLESPTPHRIYHIDDETRNGYYVIAEYDQNDGIIFSNKFIPDQAKELIRNSLSKNSFHYAVMKTCNLKAENFIETITMKFDSEDISTSN